MKALGLSLLAIGALTFTTAFAINTSPLVVAGALGAIVMTTGLNLLQLDR